MEKEITRLSSWEIRVNAEIKRRYWIEGRSTPNPKKVAEQMLRKKIENNLRK